MNSDDPKQTLIALVFLLFSGMLLVFLGAVLVAVGAVPFGIRIGLERACFAGLCLRSDIDLIAKDLVGRYRRGELDRWQAYSAALAGGAS